jgi:hypothetical protein
MLQGMCLYNQRPLRGQTGCSGLLGGKPVLLTAKLPSLGTQSNTTHLLPGRHPQHLQTPHFVTLLCVQGRQLHPCVLHIPTAEPVRVSWGTSWKQPIKPLSQIEKRRVVGLRDGPYRFASHSHASSSHRSTVVGRGCR